MQSPLSEVSNLVELWDQKYRKVTNTDTLVTFSENSEGLSYKKVNAIAHCLAAYFMKDGVNRGDRIAMLCDNTPMYLVFDLAIHFSGAVNITLSPNFSSKILKQVLREFNVKVLYLSSYDLYNKHKSWLDPIVGQLKILCNVPPSLELNESDKIVALYCATDIGKVFWREHIQSVKRTKLSIESTHKAAIFITPTGEDTYRSRQYSHKEIIEGLIRLSEDFEPITKSNPRRNFLCTESFYLYHGRLIGFYLTYFFSHKIILSRTNRTLVRDIEHSQAFAIIASEETLLKLNQAIRKQFIDEYNFRGRYFDSSFKNARKYQELREKKQSIPFGVSYKFKIARRTVLKRAKRKYFKTVDYIFASECEHKKDLEHFFLSLQAIFLSTKEGVNLLDFKPSEKQNQPTLSPELVDLSHEIE